MQPTTKQNEQIQEELRQQDEAMGDLPLHQAELLAAQRLEEESLRKLSAYLQELNPDRYPR